MSGTVAESKAWHDRAVFDPFDNGTVRRDRARIDDGTYMTKGPPDIRKSFATYSKLAALLAIAAVAAAYVTLGRPVDTSQVPYVAQSDQLATLRDRTNSLSTGAMRAFVFMPMPALLPDLSFLDAAGSPVNLKDWRGKVVLLNLWATWCASCRKEMPALDRLQGELGSDRFEVIALEVDKAGVGGAKRFFDDSKIENLKPFADPTTQVRRKLRAVGMPTTILIDAQGQAIGRLAGLADWDSDDAKRLIAATLESSGTAVR